MPLKIISGEAGSGKTTVCFEETKKIIDSEKAKIIFIVPDQLSLTYEQKISFFFKDGRPAVDVLSFERLAKRVFSTTGPIYSEYLDDAAKEMLVQRALITLDGKLNVFSGKTENLSESVLEIISEFKRYMLTPKNVLSLAENTSFPMLKFKLNDLYLIYREFEKYIKTPFADEDNCYIELCKSIEKHNLFSDTYFFIDQFTGFLPSQLEIIKKLVEKSKSVTVTLNYKESCKNELFLSYGKLLKELKNISQNITYLNTGECKKFKDNAELSFLEKNLFSSSSLFDNTVSNISVLKASDIRNEVECTAAEILRLCRINGYRFKDIAVAVRAFDKYAPIIKYTFEAYGINIYQDEKQPALLHPFVRAVLSLFEIINTNFSYEAVFSWIKFICPEEQLEKMYLMENYVLACGNSKKMWTDENGFKFLPRGFTNEDVTEFNSLKNIFMKPVNNFINKFSGRKTVKEISTAFVDFLYDADLDKKIISDATEYKNNGMLQKSNLEISAWKSLVEVLEKLVMTLGDKQITFKKYYTILRSGLNGMKIGQIPPSIDEVHIYDIERFKSQNVKCLFVLGVNNGVFPKVFNNQGILTDAERTSLAELGTELAETCEERQAAENTVVYDTLISASEKLYISYTSVLENAEPGYPSFIVENIKKVFPNVPFKDNLFSLEDDFTAVEGEKSALLKLPQMLGKGDWNQVEKWFEKVNPKRLEHIKRNAIYSNTPQKITQNAVEAIYGSTPSGSISRAEQYSRCNYAYFLKYGLKLQERRTHKIQPVDLGSFMHEIIEKFSIRASEIGWEKITEPECITIASEITEELLSSYLSDTQTESGRFYYTVEKIKKIIACTAKNIAEFYKTSEFVPLGYEITFGKSGTLPPIELNIKDKKIMLNGKIDRADVWKTDKGNFICVVDYKSGNKNIDFTEVLCGVQIQLPIYLKALCNSMEKSEITPIPAALYYYKFDSPIADGDKKMSPEKINSEIMKSLKMKGLTLESELLDVGLNSAMVVKSSVTAKQIDYLCKTAYDKLKSAFEGILNGKIDMNPLLIHGNSSCDYCPYNAVCINSSCEIKHRIRKTVKKEGFFENVGKTVD